MQEQNKKAVALRLANETICDRALDLMGEQAFAEGNAEQVADSVKTELIQMNYTLAYWAGCISNALER